MTATSAAVQWIAALALGIVTCSIEATTILQVPLSEMVADSSLIVTGEVLDVTRVCGPCPEANQLDLFSAAVRVREALKGNAGSNILVYFSSRGPSPTFATGQRAILLLQPWRDGFTTVQGYGGKLDVVGDVVPRIYVLGEPPNQSVQTVIGRIRRAQVDDASSVQRGRNAP